MDCFPFLSLMTIQTPVQSNLSETTLSHVHPAFPWPVIPHFLMTVPA